MKMSCYEFPFRDSQLSLGTRSSFVSLLAPPPTLGFPSLIGTLHAAVWNILSAQVEYKALPLESQVP